MTVVAIERDIIIMNLWTLSGIYLGSGDHYEHIIGEGGAMGVDLHDDIGTTLTPVFTENGTYSTYLFGERAVDIINNHNVDEVNFILKSVKQYENNIYCMLGNSYQFNSNYAVSFKGTLYSNY